MIAKFGLGLKELAEFLWVRFEDKQIILPEYLENIESMIKEFLDLTLTLTLETYLTKYHKGHNIRLVRKGSNNQTVMHIGRFGGKR